MAVLSVETKKISELEAASSCASNDAFVLDTALSGTQKLTYSNLVGSVKSTMNVPAVADTLLANTTISTTFENESAKVAASSTVYAAEKRLSNAEKDLLFMQGAVAYNDSWTLANLLAAIRSNDPKAYSLGDYITVDGKKWTIVAKNYYTSNNLATWKQHAVLMMYDSLENQIYNTTNTNAGGYNGSTIKTWLEGTFYNSLPSELRACILQVSVTESTMGANNVFTRSIQLPSIMQLTGTAQHAEPNRAFGPPFPVVHNALFLYGGSGAEYWTNTPVDGSTTNFGVYVAERQGINSGQSRYGRNVRPFIVIG